MVSQPSIGDASYYSPFSALSAQFSIFLSISILANCCCCCWNHQLIEFFIHNHGQKTRIAASVFFYWGGRWEWKAFNHPSSHPFVAGSIQPKQSMASPSIFDSRKKRATRRPPGWWWQAIQLVVIWYIRCLKTTKTTTTTTTTTRRAAAARAPRDILDQESSCLLERHRDGTARDGTERNGTESWELRNSCRRIQPVWNNCC